MTYEIELKFPLPEPHRVLAMLDEFGAIERPSVAQVDTYFAHPQRNFGETDEALRVRRVGDQACVTYKGPKIGTRTKTRREIELPIAPGDPAAAEQFMELLTALSFREVRCVAKRRTPYTLSWQGRSLEVALDEVEQLGTYLEIETQAGDDQRESAEQDILTLAARLGLERPEPLSYLGLLLRQDVR